MTRPPLPTAASSWRGPRLLHQFLKATPLLWCLGILTPTGVLLILKLVFERWPRGALANTVILSWMGIGVVQADACILNGLREGSLTVGMEHAVGFGVVGWLFGGLAIAAGAGHGLCDVRTVRATTWLGGSILILALGAAIARGLGMHTLLLSPTPMMLILPKSPTVMFYTSALVFQTEETFGEATTRLVLFFPWATGLGLGALAIGFISTLERNMKWRVIGISGGLVGVVFSWSRIAIAAMVGVAAILAFLRAPNWVRLAIVGTVVIVFFVLALLGINPIADISEARHAADEARAGSSLARELIYQKSWEGFLQSPLIGHGWIGESVHRIEDLPIGSHSTIFGLLYTGGWPTLLAFGVAMLLTMGAMVWRLLTGGGASAGRNELLIGLALGLCLAAYCPYEALYNLTLPCLFMLTWIGACIGCEVKIVRSTRDPPVPALPLQARPRILVASLPARSRGPLELRSRSSGGFIDDHD